MRIIRHGLAIAALTMILAGPAAAQLQPAVPAPPLHATMPTPSTASPPVMAPTLPPLPGLPAAPSPPQSPVTKAAPVLPKPVPMPEPAVVPPPVVLVPPSQLPFAQIPPGVQPDMTVPVVPVPSGQPIGPPHP